ncbi:MAG: TfoX/Sxy family protein [Eubacteriales bacterium]|nr:TfoX/Sxy family protein [Eubacteriales bacterium]
MATSVDYIEFVCDQIKGFENVRYKKMFGEYMVYVNDKPILLVCDNTVYLRKLPEKYPPEIVSILNGGEVGFPYSGAKEHYILDIENTEFVQSVVAMLEQVTPLPKPRKKKQSSNSKT